MIDDDVLDQICDTIGEPDFDSSDLHESAYRLLVERLGQLEVSLAAARHQLAEALRDRDALAVRVSVVELVGRCTSDFENEPTVEVQPYRGATS